MKRVPIALATVVLVSLVLVLTSQSTARDLNASMAQIPGLAESPDKGAFVDVVKAMDEVYPGRIIISLYPFARSMDNVIKGNADFHIPAAFNPEIPASVFAYKYATEKIGSLAMVLYSNTSKKLTKKDILDAVAKGGKFPYIIEVSGGAEANCPFPVVPTNDFEESLKKLNIGRIDAIWNAQEETDLIIRTNKFKNVFRVYWGNMDDVIVIQKSARGDEVDKIISELLRKLRASGKLEALYKKVHSPYDNWQPAAMGW